jgi:flagellar motility protein MotE (MotC chaperone)
MLTLLNLVIVVTFLMLAGIAGFLYGTGRLDKEKGQTILDLLRHKGTPSNLRREVYAHIDPTFSATATASSSAPSDTQSAATRMGDLPVLTDAPPTAVERLALAQRTAEQERLRLAQIAQDLQHRQELLNAESAQIAADRAAFDAAQTSAAKKQFATVDTAKADAFTRALTLYNSLKPKQVKDLFVNLPPADAAAYLMAMDPDNVAKIIAEFKSPAEKTFIAGVIERIRAPGPSTGTGDAMSPATAPASSTAAAAR